MNSVYINGQPLKRSSLYFIQYCADCCLFYQVSQLGNPCKVCGSKATVNASTWSTEQLSGEGVKK
ncbi:MAG: hypothetical protein MI862_26050 [Desulfobacterales bacterium]|nr:hypothetical protein [Desulfobacterales bacterium]